MATFFTNYGRKFFAKECSQSVILERMQSNEGKDTGKIINSEGGRERGRRESSGLSILKINQFSPLAKTSLLRTVGELFP